MKKNNAANNEWLQKLHKEEIRILDEFDRLCKEHNLNYFLTGGTLIGAVRHKGFIPWDDDIDVGMPRSDFEKFINICKKDLGKDFYLDCYKSQTKSFRFYAKLKLKNTLFIENNIKDLAYADYGIFVDIFPYDNIDELNSKSHLSKYNFRFIIEKMIYRKIGYSNYLSEYKKKHKIIMFFVDIFIKICSIRTLATIVRIKLSSHNNQSKYLSTMVGTLSLEKETHLRSDIFPLTKLEFEGKKYYCPCKYDKILKKVYGDYMTLPPVEKRVTHNPCKIKFSDGEVIDFDRKS